MVKVWAFKGVVPVVDPTAFVHPSAVLIGDVIVGPGAFVGPGASLRGDFGGVRLGEGCNVQDNCVMHAFPGRNVVVEADGHVGHGAVLHGCRVKRNALIGMNAVVMDGVTVGEGAFVAAMAFVKAGMEIPPRMLVAGIPATIVRQVSDQELAWKEQGTRGYQQLARDCLAGMEEAEALSAIESDAPRLPGDDPRPLYVVKGRGEPGSGA